VRVNWGCSGVGESEPYFSSRVMANLWRHPTGYVRASLVFFFGCWWALLFFLQAMIKELLLLLLPPRGNPEKPTRPIVTVAGKSSASRALGGAGAARRKVCPATFARWATTRAAP